MSFVKELEKVFDQSDDAVIVRTVDGKIDSWNKFAAKLYGWNKEEAIGKISHDLLGTQFPKPLKEIDSEVFQNGHWEGELVHLTRDNGRVAVNSRWILDPTDHSGVVLEINAPSSHDTTFAKVPPVLTRGADVVLMIGAVVSAFLLLYFFHEYAWAERREFRTPIFAALYYIIPTALATFLFLSLRFKSVTKIKIVLPILSLLVTVYALELFLVLSGATPSTAVEPAMTRLARSSNKKDDAERLGRAYGVEIDIRNRKDVIADYGKEGVEAVPVVTPSNHLFVKLEDGRIKSSVTIDGGKLPLAGISNKTTILCNESGEWITYPSDEHGFNNPTGIWEEKSIQIAALGDSFTHGYCVPPDRNFVSLIRQHYPSTLNLGVSGDGPLLELAKINEFLEDRKPQTVLWFYYEGNDLTDLQSERKSDLVMDYLQDGFRQNALAQQNSIDLAIMSLLPKLGARESANLEKRQTIADGIVESFFSIAKLSILRQKVGLVGGEDAGFSGEKADLDGANMYVFRAILTRAKSRVDAWGGHLFFVYLPEWARYSHYTSWGKAKRDEVLQIVHDLEIPVIDLNPAFEAQGDPLSLFPFRQVGHYTESGNQVVAKEVLDSLSVVSPKR